MTCSGSRFVAVLAAWILALGACQQEGRPPGVSVTSAGTDAGPDAATPVDTPGPATVDTPPVGAPDTANPPEVSGAGEPGSDAAGVEAGSEAGAMGCPYAFCEGFEGDQSGHPP